MLSVGCRLAAGRAGKVPLAVRGLASSSPAPPLPTWCPQVLRPESAVAAEGFEARWRVMLPAFATHMCIGTGWAWSVVSSTIVREHGWVSPAASDWGLLESTMPMPILFTAFGLVGAAAGKWQAAAGPRASVAVAAGLFGGGVALGGCGVAWHSLGLLNLGYGVMAGAGVGMAYTPPIQALMQWFPDRKGLAVGTLVAGFGSGALVTVPLMGQLMRQFGSLPTFVGPMDSCPTTTRDGVLFAQQPAGEWVEVVQATSAELAHLDWPGLSEGLYLVGSGSTGAAEALMLCGAGYFGVMSAAAMTIRTPRPGACSAWPGAHRPGRVAA